MWQWSNKLAVDPGPFDFDTKALDMLAQQANQYYAAVEEVYSWQQQKKASSNDTWPPTTGLNSMKKAYVCIWSGFQTYLI